MFVIKSGWVRRTQLKDDHSSREMEDFLGEGYCLGLEGVARDAKWPYTVTLLGRCEVLEISIGKLRQNRQLCDEVLRVVGQYSAPETVGERVSLEPGVREKILETQERLIDTGLVDGTNLLVMDMDLCVRCGNCSMACHKIHGQSRLTRRGISFTRLETARAGDLQRVLSPAVCMHCKDPECLTGCPTGAIGRMAGGHIDIDAKTCIGCGDCATQCPYNAISLVSRKKPQPPKAGFGGRILDLLRLRPDPLPPAVEQTDDLLAVKCNLCDSTPLNANGGRRAYGCEESCPTGALARINPREYFAEIGQIQGLAFLDTTHAVGRNIHRSDPPRKMLHLLGLVLTVLLTGAAVWGLAAFGLGGRLAGFLNMRWITGIVGLVGIVGVMTYPVRRKIYRKRAGPLRYWLLIHSYLGVIAGIMLLLHGGTDSGGPLTTALMISFDLVIFTGIFGIVCYLAVPRLMTKIEGEPLLVDDLKARREELRRELAEMKSTPPLGETVNKKIVPQFLSFGYLLRQYLRRESLDEAIRSAKESFRSRAPAAGADQRTLERAVETAVTLRRVDALINLHRLLKAWLVPHVLFTSLMLALMVVHIIQVVYFA
jgi:Fe-S-cluster-containing dehydrogenase component